MFLACRMSLDRLESVYGGEGGIRTPDTVSGMPVFKTGAINHSATSPARKPLRFTALRYGRPVHRWSFASQLRLEHSPRVLACLFLPRSPFLLQCTWCNSLGYPPNITR